MCGIVVCVLDDASEGFALIYYAPRLQVDGPGGPNIVVGPDGGAWLTYHSADPAASNLTRELCLAPITWTPGGPLATLTWQSPVLRLSLY